MSRYIDADKLKERLGLVSVDAITLYEMGINAGLHRAERNEENGLPFVVKPKHCDRRVRKGG